MVVGGRAMSHYTVLGMSCILDCDAGRCQPDGVRRPSPTTGRRPVRSDHHLAEPESAGTLSPGRPLWAHITLGHTQRPSPPGEVKPGKS